MDNLPELESISIRNFVAARANEIVSLVSNYCKDKNGQLQQSEQNNGKSGKSLAFQHVPKHMRRRAVSHNPKRLPARLRSVHLAQVTKSSGGLHKKPKVPSRKFRRRKSNLLAEYNRRQRRVKWIETHIWHAKRFFIAEKWGWKIPQTPCDKGYRALYRAVSSEAAMTDLSYFSLVKLTLSNVQEAEEQEIWSNFEKTFIPHEANHNIQFQQKDSIEGQIQFYCANSYPFGYIGHVSYFWGNCQELESKSLFLWLHPSYKNQIIDEISKYFQLTCMNSETNEIMDTDENEGAKKSINLMKYGGKLKQSLRTNVNGTVNLVDFENAINRFRILGPKSLSVLDEILKPSDVNNEESLQSLVNSKPSSYIHQLCVHDPRIYLPQKRTKVVENEKNSTKVTVKISNEKSTMIQIQNQVVVSDLFDQQSLKKILQEKISDHELSTRRGQFLIPGSQLTPGQLDNENKIPILLISKCKGDNSKNQEFDLILPCGWAMSFWISLSYRCVRTFGHEDYFNVALEKFNYQNIFQPPFSLRLPDSTASIEETTERGLADRKIYFGLSPPKRSNYHKLKCPFPFSTIRWDILLQFWSTSTSLDPSIQPETETENRKYFILRDHSVISKLQQQPCELNDNSFTFDMNSCLVVVRLVIIGKGGAPQNGGVICLPNDQDLLEDYSGKKIIQEPHGIDSMEKSRKELRQIHQKKMAFLRKKRKKLRQKCKSNENDKIIEELTKDINKFSSVELSEVYNNQMNELWIPQDHLSVLKSMSRKPMGFILQGQESLSRGQCIGVGIVTLQSLVQLFKSANNDRCVLLRNCKTEDIFRKAELSLVTQFYP